MKLFITGGTGLLGKHVVARLLQANNELFILTRKPRTEPLYQHANIHMIEGSLETITDWQHYLQEVDTVIHMAAPVVFWGEWAMYKQSIVDATKNLVEAAATNGVTKFIYISSESVLQSKKDLMAIDETEPYPAEPNSYYGKTKMLAEEAIMAVSTNMIRIILRPTFIWGEEVDGLKTMVKKIETGGFMWIDKGSVSMEMVHVENVAEAIFLAVTKGTEDNIFFVTDDEPKTTKHFLTDVLAVMGATPPDKNLSGKLARPAAAAVETLWRTLHFKGEPPLTRFDLSFLAMNRSYNIRKIKEVLGYSPVVDYQTGLTRMKKNGNL